MRSLLLVTATVTLAGLSAAQGGPPLNLWAIHPGENDTIGRAGIPGGSAGDVLTSVDPAWFQYIGNACNPTSTARINGFVAAVWDLFGSSREAVSFTVVPEDPSAPGQPDPNPATEVLRTTQLLLPPFAGAGPAVWQLTATLLTPYEDANLTTSQWYFGIGLPANGKFPSDGLTVLSASYYGQPPPTPTTHDNPRNGTPLVAWGVDRTLAIAAQPTTPVTHDMGILTDAAVFSPGQDVVATARTSPTINPMFGVGGLYPDTTGQGAVPAYANRNGNPDGAAFRVRHGQNQGGQAFLFLSSGFASFPLKLSGFGGTFPANPLFFQLAPTGPNPLVLNPANGQVEAIIAPPYTAQGSIRRRLNGTIHWFAMTVDASVQNLTFTNAGVIIFG